MKKGEAFFRRMGHHLRPATEALLPFLQGEAGWGPYPFFTKLSSTFLVPAFSKSIVSLLPSMLITSP